MIGERQAQIINAVTLSERLRAALAALLYQEARRLGLSFEAAQITALCDTLLMDVPRSPSTSILKESALFDTYRAENLGVHDYLHLVSQEMRRRLGQYITPSLIVRYILDAVGYRPDADIAEKRLTDPACGSGVFLVEALRVYLAHLRRVAAPIEAWYPRLREAFVGIDIDPIACLYARFNISLLLAPAILSCASLQPDRPLPPLPIYCLDTVRALATELKPSLLHDDTSSFPLIRSADFVVGNPPYHKIGQLDRALKEVFRDSLYGHPNAYGLFLHAGLEMLHPGGVLGYIIPRSMLSGLYFQNLRQFVEEHAVLREITLIAERKGVFENVLQGTMILVVQRQPVAGAPRLLRTAAACSVVDIETRQMPAAEVAPARVIRHLNGTSVWFVSDSRKAYDILDKIIATHPLLSAPEVGWRAKTGPVVWNRVKPLLREHPEVDTLPLVWATDVGRFAFEPKQMGGRPAYLKVTPRMVRLVSRGACLLVQRVTADEQPHRLVACIPEGFCREHTAGYFVENHINVIQPLPTAPPTDPYYLLGILCSDAAEFFFRLMNGNTQVSATELNLIPVPLSGHERQISALARQLQDTPARADRAALETQLQQLVAAAYGLTRDELRFVQMALSRSCPTRRSLE